MRLTVICMLTGYTFCIPLPSKKASDVVTAYVDNVYAKLEVQRRYCQIMEQSLKINFLKK